MEVKKIKDLIQIFGNHGGEGSPCPFSAKDHQQARKILIEQGEETIDLLLQSITEWITLCAEIDAKKVVEECSANSLKNFDKKSIEEYCQLQCVKDRYKITHCESIVFDVVEVLGEIGNKKAIPYLKRILKTPYDMDITWRNTAVALIKLGDASGVHFLKNRIKNVKSRSESRMRAAEALLKLGIRNIFKKDEKISYKAMEGITAEMFSQVVDRLREK